MNSDKKNIKLIVELIEEAGENAAKAGIMLHDLFVYTDKSEGIVSISCGEDRLLATKVIYDFILTPETENISLLSARTRNTIKEALNLLLEQGFFNRDLFLKPFSVVYIPNGEDTEAEEMIFIDDDLIRIDDPLLANMDEELDLFIQKLLES